MDARDTRVARNNWNIVQGCTKVSPGCKNCYVAHTMGDDFGNVRFNEAELDNLPIHEIVFVSDSGDLFHEDIADTDILKAIVKMQQHEDKTFLICTRRTERARNFLYHFWPHMFLTVSAENQEELENRLKYLTLYEGPIVISAQPLLGPITLPWRNYEMVVVGGEYGEGRRPMDEDWVRALRDQCENWNIKFSYQQCSQPDGTREMFPLLDGQRHVSSPGDS